MEVSGHADIIPSPEHRPLIPSWSGVRTLELQGNQVILKENLVVLKVLKVIQRRA